MVGAVATGFGSWAVGTSWTRFLTLAHGVLGLTVVVLAPWKARGSVRTGLRRRRTSRWLSLGLAAAVATTVVLGVLHATGLWFGVGEWSALWTHVLAAIVVATLLAWHVVSRPSRPTLTDLDRRGVLAAGLAVVAGAAVYGAQELLVRAVGTPGARRRFTGSHEVASFQPEAMPRVSWLNDQAPDATTATGWRLAVAGAPVEVARLAALARPVEATLDCTGGWWSTQSWDAVPLADLLGGGRAASVQVTSATGYDRLFPFADVDALYLAVGYGGQPLARGHGAPVRLVAPGRRGLWWVKWVTAVDLSDRPAWLQLPFPAE